MSELKKQFTARLTAIIDGMEDEEVFSLLDIIDNDEQERDKSELIAIRGEIKKLTKMVYKSIEANSKEVEEVDEGDENRELKPLIDFHQFLLNSKESLDSLPEISHFGLDKFKKPFYAFEKGFADIEMLYIQLMEHFGLIETAKIGAKFDPTLHEAIEVEHSKSKGINTITEVYYQGYRVDDNIVKYAKVKVNKGEE